MLIDHGKDTAIMHQHQYVTSTSIRHRGDAYPIYKMEHYASMHLTLIFRPVLLRYFRDFDYF